LRNIEDFHVGRLQLMDRWQLRLAGTGDDILCGPTAQRLLALLALHGSMSRAQIVDHLWPLAGPERGTGSLRTALWRLDPRVRTLVIDQGGRMRLPTGLQIDVTEVNHVAASISRGEGADTNPRILASELLPAWFADDWLIVERERLRQTTLSALDSLAGQLTQAGRYDEAVTAARFAIQADPLRESAHGQIMVAYAAKGNLGEVIRHHEACRTLFLRELGIEPSGALRRLVNELQASPKAKSSLAFEPGGFNDVAVVSRFH